MPADPREYAAVLYERLHEADSGGWDWIAIEQPPRGRRMVRDSRSAGKSGGER